MASRDGSIAANPLGCRVRNRVNLLLARDDVDGHLVATVIAGIDAPRRPAANRFIQAASIDLFVATPYYRRRMSQKRCKTQKIVCHVFGTVGG